MSGPVYAKPPTKAIVIETTPPGAKIYVDSKQEGIACQTSPDCKIRVPKGKHTLIIELDGHKSHEEAINVSRPQRFTFTLHALQGKLEVKPLASNPSSNGGEIYVDGRLSGNVPATVELAAGKHTLEVKREGFQAYTESFEIKSGETRPVLIALVAEPKAAPVAAPPPPPPSPAAPAPVVAPPPGVTGYPVTIVPRNPDFVYIATMGDGQSCSTPCTLHQPAGPTRISVAGPGSKLFQQALMMPSGPSQLRLQHFTMGRAIAGTILLVLGIPALGAGGWLVDRGLTEFRQGSPDFPIPLGVGSFVLAHGVVFTLVGIIQLATIKTNSVRLISLGSSTALNAPRLRLTAGGIAPTADRAGAMAGLTFSY